MAELSKEERKARVREFKANELATVMGAMQLKPLKLRQLINFLEGSLYQAGGCDRTLRFTRGFLSAENVDAEKVIEWLRDSGGGCDCEVIANLDELSMTAVNRSAGRKAVPPPQSPFERKTQVERSLETVTGWDFSSLPSPWRVANRFKPEEPLQLEFGKRGRCTLTVFEKSLPRGDRSNDQYWEQRYRARVRKLSGFGSKGPYRVTRGAFQLPPGCEAVVVSGDTWRTLGWIAPEKGKWHLELMTEAQRVKGDLPEIEALLRHLAG